MTNCYRGFYKIYVLLRILYLYENIDIYGMKNSVIIEEDQTSESTGKNPVVIILTITVILILLLNLIGAFVFY